MVHLLGVFHVVAVMLKPVLPLDEFQHEAYSVAQQKDLALGGSTTMRCALSRGRRPTRYGDLHPRTLHRIDTGCLASAPPNVACSVAHSVAHSAAHRS